MNRIVKPSAADRPRVPPMPDNQCEPRNVSGRHPPEYAGSDDIARGRVEADRAKSGIFADDSPGRGRGVFAGRPFQKSDLIEACPVIVLSASETALIDGTRLYDYYFGWERDQAAIALGFGSLYNHSKSPNAMYVKDYTSGVIRVHAIADIDPGDEIFIKYNNGKSGSTESLWFDVK